MPAPVPGITIPRWLWLIGDLALLLIAATGNYGIWGTIIAAALLIIFILDGI